MRARVALAIAGVALGCAGSRAPRPPLGQDDLAYTYGVGTFAPAYAPPAPGTYELPPIGRVGDHPVLDAAGRATTLGAVIGDRLAVVSFVYGSCAEATGCPVSTAALHHLDHLIADDPDLATRVTLVTVSFDPERDTPEKIAAMRALHAPRSDWQFVTTRDPAQLQPLLDDFDQPVAKLRYPDGTWTGTFRHVLKVYLLDRRRRVRNEYSVGFLHPALVLNDLRTLRLEDAAAPKR